MAEPKTTGRVTGMAPLCHVGGGPTRRRAATCSLHRRRAQDGRQAEGARYSRPAVPSLPRDPGLAPASSSRGQGRNPNSFSIAMPSRRACVQVMGRAWISPLCSAWVRRSRASRMIRRWRSRWKGTPKWCPIMNGTKTARGGLTWPVMSRATVTETVGMPRRSMARCTSATDWCHIGQAGASKAASAPSAMTASAISSASVCSRRLGSML